MTCKSMNDGTSFRICGVDILALRLGFSIKPQIQEMFKEEI